MKASELTNTSFPRYALPARAKLLAKGEVERLEAWLLGQAALDAAEASRLLRQAFASGQLAGNKASHVAGVKALAAGEASWPAMGLMLLSS